MESDSSIWYENLLFSLEMFFKFDFILSYCNKSLCPHWGSSLQEGNESYTELRESSVHDCISLSISIVLVLFSVTPMTNTKWILVFSLVLVALQHCGKHTCRFGHTDMPYPLFRYWLLVTWIHNMWISVPSWYWVRKTESKMLFFKMEYYGKTSECLS